MSDKRSGESREEEIEEQRFGIARAAVANPSFRRLVNAGGELLIGQLLHRGDEQTAVIILNRRSLRLEIRQGTFRPRRGK